MVHHPFGNFWLKVISLGIALLLWFSVSRDALVERSIRVPLEFQNIPEVLEIVGDAPSTADVRVRGASSILARLEPGDVVAVLDLKGARQGSRLFHLITDQVRAPFGIDVSQVAPPTVALTFERSGSKVVPVRPAVEGEPAAGYVLGRATCDPDSVEVVGPESRLEQLQEATTEPVSVEGAAARVEDRVTIGVVDGALRLRTPRSATVRVEVVPAPIERSINGVEVRPLGLDARRTARVEPNAVSVVVRGARERLAGLAPSDVQVHVDLATLGPGRYTLPVQAEPADFAVVGIDPKSVQVRIR
jgi:YbbR domain-containing protein